MALHNNDIRNQIDTSINNLPEEYIVRVVAPSLIKPKGEVKAALPENFDFSVESEYAPAFPGGAASFVDDRNKAFGNLLRLNGYNMMTREMSLQVWQGSAPIDLSIPFEFIAENDPYLEITKPIADLLKLTVPRTVGDRGGFLRAPGPTIDVNIDGIKGALTDAKTGDVSKAITVVDPIAIYIGKHLYFPEVIIRSVGQAYNVQYAKGGNPIRATVTVNFSTLFTPTAADIDVIFQIKSEAREGVL